MESCAGVEALPSEMSVPHLLLNQHLLNTDACIVYSVDLSTNRTSLIAPRDRPYIGCPIVYIVLSSNTGAPLTTLLLFILNGSLRDGLFVPHKGSETIPLYELACLVLSRR